MSKAICSECGCPIEIVNGEEWAYCPMCDNDQVEVSRHKQITVLQSQLAEKDQQITELQKQIEEKDEEIKGLNKKLDNLWSIYSLLGVEAFGNDIQEQALKEIVKLQRKNDVKKLKKQLKTNTKQSQKQLAIEELKKIYNLFEPYENSQKDTILCANNGISFIDYLENQIKELDGVDV